MQRLLNHARWDTDLVRDAPRAQVAERLGDASGVLVVAGTGFEKKGRRSSNSLPTCRCPSCASF
ncbi:hypothetical protein GWI34_09205 [Actinomadura sp. DSM 109109]|nr:hypothetical protein [Actinomadura lepetitiana]